MSKIILAGVAGIALWSSVANADVVASDPESLIGALQTAGYQAKLGKDNSGDPMIESRAAGYRFRVIFFGCKDGANCSHVTFQAGFSTKQKPTLEQINAWNYDKAISKAAIDKEGDPWVRIGLWLPVPVTDDYMKEFLELWDQTLGEFAKRFAK